MLQHNKVVNLKFVWWLDLDWFGVESKPVLMSLIPIDETCKTKYVRLLSNLISLVPTFINSSHNGHDTNPI